ncbi:Alanine--tRNA ligase [bacterium HR29]|jgi:alanyl-tRNA synthetase|nr:Alanine--tRNA ligase [bacterium HR29]
MGEPPRTSDEIRTAFVEFFKARGHVELPPWPLVPIGDPTSLFTSAGMQQFKPIFLGEEPPQHRRVVTVQRCFRTTDIEEVGDLHHCTAFEMLGNFSFGDYFKREAIRWAWELLTEVYRIDPDRLHVTIYLDDDEAHQYWREVGLPESHIHRYGEEKNYWFSFPTDTPGASGPCGPDSEIYFDYFPERGLEGIDVANDSERFLEIWNLVFMQLYQRPDGSRVPLPAKNIDTGSGLERVAAVQQGKRSVFETDVFLPVLEAAARVAGVEYFGGGCSEEQAYAVRAMAEHCRAAALLIGDGVVPSNEGRGYVLRRVIRRAVYFARRIGVERPFTAVVAEAAIGKLKGAYPHLAQHQDFILRALQTEEERFLRTIAAGTARLEALLERLEASDSTTIPGEEAFVLYDTFGLPLELTREIAASRGFLVDGTGFERALERQRQRARQQGTFLKGEPSPALQALGSDHSSFVGYTHVETDARVVGILSGGQLVDRAVPNGHYDVVLDTTPFYPEGGGQLGDRGVLRGVNGVFRVEDTQAHGGAIVHRGYVEEGELRVLDLVDAEVDLAWRRGATYHHTATHMLHAGLRLVLGPHVRQQGSLVAPDRLRFDFTHLEQTPREALREVQALVNEKVRRDLEVRWRTTTYQQAIASGALAFFGDKYGTEVRVVEISDDGERFSAELCGGTHVHHTGELGFIYIVREGAVAAGIRRIEALAGPAAEAYLVEQTDRLQRLAEKLSASPAELEARIEALQVELERLRKQAQQLERAQAAAVTEAALGAAVEVDGSHLVVAQVDVPSHDMLKEVADRVRQRLGSALVILAALVDGRPSFLAAATRDLVERGVHAGNLVREIAKAAGGGGGGRPDLAQAGARDASRLEAALEQARHLGRQALSRV